MMIPNTYRILERCVEEGVSYGYERAFKHTENPSSAAIKEAIHDEVMNSICSWFDFKNAGSTGEFEK